MAVPEDLVEEFLLRLPPSDPASLVRAALVCKPWCRLISTPGFRRRFREFHRKPPMLGFLANTTKGPRFVSTTSFPPPPALAEFHGWQVLDARHGRVLLGSMDDMDFGSPALVVWGPVTNERWKLPLLTLCAARCRWNAVVLCAAASGSCDCDHLDCQRGGPFLVVLVAGAAVAQSTLSVYSSESRAWSEPRPLPSCRYVDVAVAPTVLVGTTLYFLGIRILGYDLATGETFVFSLPPRSAARDTTLITTEDGGLGVASGVAWQIWGGVAPSNGFRLSLWSMEKGPDGDIRWARIRVVELRKLLPVRALSTNPITVGFAPGVLFFDTVDGLFSVNLISNYVKKVLDNNEICVTEVIP